MTGAPLTPPEKLNVRHDLSPFDSGEPALDQWLRRRALANEDSGASRTYVVCEEDGHVVGFYALASGALSQAVATGRARRNMPDPVPVIVLGRLAIDRSRQGEGLGRALVRDAILRTVQAADIAGIRALLVHAKSEQARRFYERCGFTSSPVDPMTLMVTIQDAVKALKGSA